MKPYEILKANMAMGLVPRNAPPVKDLSRKQLV